jgi:hypothetical protein
MKSILPHSALSWNLSLAENLKSLSLQDRATKKWHYFPTKPPSHPNRFVKLNISTTIVQIFLKFGTEAYGTKRNFTESSNEDNLRKMTSKYLPWKTISKYYKWNIIATTDRISLKF